MSTQGDKTFVQKLGDETRAYMSRATVAPAVDTGTVLAEELRFISVRRERLKNAEHPLAGINYDYEAVSADPKDWTRAACERRLEAYYKAAHKVDDLSALCLSGGGIRSAAFALGVVQALAAHKLLQRFDYLSTVSGGGYIGSWLTGWLSRERFATVIDKLNSPESDATGADTPVQYLRRYSNFLTPKTGLLSSDTLAAAILYIRNLMLNWLVLFPFLIAVILAPKIVAIVGYGLIIIPSADWILGIAGIVLIACNLLFSLWQRPGWEVHRFTMKRFRWTQIVPLSIGAHAVALATLAHLRSPGESFSLVASNVLYAALTGAIVYAVVWLGAYVFMREDNVSISTSENLRSKQRQEASALRRVSAFAAFAVSGAVLGALVFLLLQALALVPPDHRVLAFLCFGAVIVVLAYLFAEMVYTGISSYLYWGDAEREWLARSAGHHARFAVAWALFMALVLFGATYGTAIIASAHSIVTSASTLGLTAAVTALLAKSPVSPATLKSAFKSAKAYSINTLLMVLTPLLIAGTTIFVSSVFDFYAFDGKPIEKVLEGAWSFGPLWIVGGTIVGLVAFGTLFSYFVNVNRFSLHGVYRNRLIRAFLGASRAEGRTPNPFTNFDEKDNLRLGSIWPGQLRKKKQKERPEDAGGPLPPIHVVNMALNVVATKNLAWQERKAMSFTATPRYVGCGSFERSGQSELGERGYRRATQYGGMPKGMTLGTAMTLSGAAASPNMGYHSSPALSVLLTLANVRLGGWLGNPRSPEGDRTAHLSGPRFAAVPLLNEAFGQTTDDASYVNISDGGHFENLAVYEVLRRRCKLIVVSDAGCDLKYDFGDLGNLVRKAWIDLGVKVKFRALSQKARQTPPEHGPYCAVADITYPERNAPPGLLLYIKPGFHGGEPASVIAYALAQPDFPHESTADQWFSESQLEAYRALGEHIVDRIFKDRAIPDGDLKAFIESGYAEAVAVAAAEPARGPVQPAEGKPQ